MLQTICYPCRLGAHDEHTPIIQRPPEGMLGGAACRCEGECVDGRYKVEIQGLDEIRKFLKDEDPPWSADASLPQAGWQDHW